MRHSIGKKSNMLPKNNSPHHMMTLQTSTLRKLKLLSGWLVSYFTMEDQSTAQSFSPLMPYPCQNKTACNKTQNSQRTYCIAAQPTMILSFAIPSEISFSECILMPHTYQSICLVDSQDNCSTYYLTSKNPLK